MQGRPANELALAGSAVDAATGSLRERPAAPSPALVPLHGVEPDLIPCYETVRTVGQDKRRDSRARSP